MRVLVTGGNGFIGSVVVRRLFASGHRAHCLLRPTSRTDRIDTLPVTRAIGDVLDHASIVDAMSTCDATIHLAAPASWQDEDAASVSEVIESGTRNVLTAAASRHRHRVVVVSSTAAINGSDTPVVYDERSPYTLSDPALWYAHAKHRAEQHAHDAFARGVPVVIVNPAEVYGPGDTQLGTAGNLVDMATSNPVLACHGGTSVVYVDDVAAGIVAALDRGTPGERYILGGENVTVRELAALCLAHLGRRARMLTLPNRAVRVATTIGVRLRLPLPYDPHVVPYATRYWMMDNAKARRELGVTFRGARETIGLTLDWLRATGHVR